MNATLEQRISALIHGSLEEVRSIASALSLRLRHLLSGRAGRIRAAKEASTVKSSRRGERLDIRDLRGFGGIRSDYDHKALRTEDTRRS